MLTSKSGRLLTAGNCSILVFTADGNMLHQRAEEFGHLSDLFYKIDLIDRITDCITGDSTARVPYSFIGSDASNPISRNTRV